MKLRILAGIVFILLVLLVPSIFAVQYVEDDFEDADISDWTNAGGDPFAANTSLPRNGTYGVTWTQNGDVGYENLVNNPAFTTAWENGDTLQVWFRRNGGASDHQINFYGDNGNYMQIKMSATSIIRYRCTTDTDTNLYVNTTTNVWYRAVLTRNSAGNWGIKLYDFTGNTLATATNVSTSGCNLGTYFDKTELNFYDHTDSNNFKVFVDDISIPEESAAVAAEKQREQVIEIEQNAPVVVNSQSFQDIKVENFTATYSGAAYLSTSIESYMDKDRTQECRVLVNDVDYNTTVTRSKTANEIGISYIVSSLFNVSNASETQIKLQCRRTETSGKLTINHSDTIIHELCDCDGDPLNYDNIFQNLTIDNNTYELLYETNFTTSNKTLGSYVRFLKLDGRAIYNYDSTGTIDIIVQINETNTSEFKRYGSAGSTGKGGIMFLSDSVAGNTNIPIKIYAKSTTSDGNISFKANIAELIMSSGEFDNGYLVNKTFNNTGWASIHNITIDNSDGDVSDLVAKATISTTDTENTTIYYRFVINNTVSQQYGRQLSNLGSGVSILQNLFTNLSGTNITVELQAEVSGGNATITGGNFMAYLTNQTESTPLLYNVTAYDFWTNASLTNFTVVNQEGTEFITTDGVAEITPTNGEDNLTIVATDYYNATELNHDTTTNLNISVYQSIVNVTSVEIMSNTTINNFTLTTDAGVFTTANGTFTINPSINSYLWNYSTPYHLSQTNANFTITGGEQNLTIEAYDAVLNVFAQINDINTTINNYTITLYSANYSYTKVLNTTSGIVTFGVLQNETYNLTFNSTDYATTTANVSVNSTQTEVNYTFNAFQTNSVSIFIRDESTNALIENITFQLDFVSDTDAFSINTTNGTAFQGLITPEDYEIRYYSVSNDNYKLRSYFFTLVNQSFNTITLYALDENTTDITRADITFLVLDSNLEPVENAFMVVQRYFLTSNGFEAVYNRYTNVDGEAYGTFESIDAFYRYLVYYNDVLEYASSSDGTQFATDQTITIYIDPQAQTIEQINDVFTLEHNLTFTALTNYSGYFELEYTNPNIYQVCLEVSNQTNSLTTTCQASTSGTIQINVTHDNTSLTNYIAQVSLYDSSLGYYLVINKASVTYWPNDIFVNANLRATAGFIVALILVAIMLLFYNYPIVGMLAQVTVFIILASLPLQIVQISIATIGLIVGLVLGVVFIAQKNR